MTAQIIANPMSFTQLSLEVAIRKVLDLGYDQVELWYRDLEPYGTRARRQHLRDFVELMGSRIVGLNAADAPYFQSLGEATDVESAIAGLTSDITTAAEFGADYVCTYEGRVPAGATPGQIHGPVFEATCTVFKQACEQGARRDVSILVEVHPFTLGTDIDWLCRLCDAIDTGPFGVVYDPCHFAVALPDGYIGAIRTLDSRIKAVHFSDSDKRTSELHFPPGKGCLDLDGILDALRQVGFNGSWMVDHWLYPLPEEAARTGLAYLRDALAQFPGTQGGTS